MWQAEGREKGAAGRGGCRELRAPRSWVLTKVASPSPSGALTVAARAVVTGTARTVVDRRGYGSVPAPPALAGRKRAPLS